MELIVLVLLVLVAAVMVAYSLWPGAREDAEAVRRRAMGLSAEAPRPMEDLRKKARSAARRGLIERAAPMLSRPMMPKSDTEASNLRTRLAGAGFRNPSAATVFLASKTTCAIVLGGLGLSFALGAGKTPANVFGQFAVCAGLGFLMPEVWLYLARKQRIDAIRNGLPDSLDLLVVSVEAGLGLDAGLQRVGEEMQRVHPELSEELQIATVETQMGIQRSEALQRMAVRTDVDEMKALVAVVTQAERLGTSIAKALRTQAEVLRTKRRQKAEERAQKTAVKLMLPLILFIFPAILIVLGAPAGIKLYQTLSQGGPLSGS